MLRTLTYGALAAALSVASVRAEEKPHAIQMTRACFLVEDVDFNDMSVTPLFVDDFGMGWVRLHRDGLPDFLAVLADKAGEKVLCLIAKSAGNPT